MSIIVFISGLQAKLYPSISRNFSILKILSGKEMNILILTNQANTIRTGMLHTAILGEGEVIMRSSHETAGQVMLYLDVELDSPSGYTKVSRPTL